MNEPTGDWKMAQALQKAEESQELAVIKPDAATLVQAITNAASNPDFNADTMRALLDAHRQLVADQAEVEFNEAMARVQAELPTVVRKSENQQTNSRFAKHEAIAKAIKPIYTREGFSITFSEDDSPREKHIRIVGILRHKAGYKERHHIDVAIDDVGIKGNTNKTLTHAEGSSQTYGRRRLTCLMFDVATGDDDDGNAAGGEPISTITDEQAEDLEAKIEEVGADKAKFLAVAKVDAIEEIRQDRFKAALEWLDRYAKSK